jgi:phage-related tail fiber protein
MLTTILTALKSLAGLDPKAILDLLIKGSVVLLAWYALDLRDSNSKLQVELNTLRPVAEKQVKLLAECDTNTKALKEAEKKNTSDAKAAVEQAKKEAQAEHERADDLARRRPKEIIVTKDNAKDFGGTDNAAQMKDYLATHDLANEEIERRAKK